MPASIRSRLCVVPLILALSLLAVSTGPAPASGDSAHRWVSGTLPLTFDFETGLQGWHIRPGGGQYYGEPGSERLAHTACPACDGNWSLEFRVDLRASRENRGHIQYLFPAGAWIPPGALFTAWVWISPDAPPSLESEFWVQSGADWSRWNASRPRAALAPGQWTYLVGRNTWTSDTWISPLRAIGIEIKALDTWPVPVGEISVRVDNVRVYLPPYETFMPLLTQGPPPERVPQVKWPYRGASIAGYTEHAYAPQGNAYEIVDQLKAIGVNAVTVLATWQQDDVSTSVIERSPQTPRDEDLISLIDYAHSKGLKVVLKPHVDPINNWRGNIAPIDPQAWFDSFVNDFLLHYARIAESHGVEMLVIGTEYQTLDHPPYIDYWARVIAETRQTYHGLLTYAATEHSLFDGKLPAWFWRSLDLISLTLYHQFSEERTPQVAPMMQRWNEVLPGLQQVHEAYQLPVMLAEVGYRSIDYAGIEAWRTEGPNIDSLRGINMTEQSIAYNGAGQANLYDALLRVLGDKDWMAGMFMWQFVPSGGCGDTFQGGSGNTDYTVLGKPAALVIHDWFGGPRRAPSQWSYNAKNPWVHTFEYWAPEYVPFGWQIATSGLVTFTVDTNQHPATSTRSITVDSHVPLETNRFQQMDTFFCDGDRDWTDYKSIELWVRTDMQEGEPQGCELGIGLIDGRSQDREQWLSSQWLDRYPADVPADGWRQIRVALSNPAKAQDDPWRHPTDFVIPQWAAPVNGTLDLTAVRGVRLKMLTTDESSSPDCRVWLGPLRASAEDVEIIPPPTPPVLEMFEYAHADTVAQVWKKPRAMPGTVQFVLDATRYAPTGDSTRSLHIHTETPCASPRFEQVTNHLLGGGVDLTAYRSLTLWAGGDLRNEPPYGGEFTVMIEDKDRELWQSTRWLGRTIQGAEYATAGLEPVRISLTSFVADTNANPWHHPVDFVLTDKGHIGNRVLDRDLIRSVTLKTLTTDEYCADHPGFDVWVDRLVASSATVTPPQLAAPPVLDRFEYGDNETARIIWKWVSSGRMNVASDASVYAPGGSMRSLHIASDVPAGDARFGQVFNIFVNGAHDFSPYRQLRFWARTAPRSSPPYGGELSLELVEASGEVWRNTRWFGNKDGQWININLVAGSSSVADPWDPAFQNSFVVPRLESYVNGLLELGSITEIRVISLSTREDAQQGRTRLDLWVDEMSLVP